MNWSLSPAVLFFLLLSLASCSTEVELEGPWKDIPVVYGFINVQDTAHYLRVEKAFLPQGADARQAAQIPDSLYYDEQVVVQLENLANGRRFTLRRVDGALEGYPRREGPFAQAPNYLYKIRNSEIKLEGGEQLRLIINRGDQVPQVTAETTILEPVVPRTNIPSSPINMGYERQINFSWSAGPSARIYDLRLIIYYRESNSGNPSESQTRSLVWVLDDAYQINDLQNRLNFSFQGRDFYRYLAENIPAGGGLIRFFDRMDFQITAAGQELVDLLRIEEANVGLTSFQTVPVYSNLSEGRGIFSSRTFAQRQGLTLDSPSLDSLRNGVITRQLNFR